MASEKKLNFVIEDGDSFFAHETSINFSPIQFVIDFKSITPRVDVRSQQSPIMVMKHNVILLEPIHAKKLAELLTKTINKYESEFGTIEPSEAIKKQTRKMKRKAKSEEGIPEYFG